MRRLVLTLAALGLLAATGLAGLAGAPPAAAHGDLVGGSPGPGDELAPGAALLRLDFEDLAADAPGYLALSDEQGRPLRVGDATVAGDSLCARTEELEPGVYAVDYVATSADQHRLDGRYEFAVTEDGEPSDPGGCDVGALAAAEEARTIEETTTGGLPGWVPWAVGAGALAAALAVVGRVLRDRRQAQSPA